MTCPKRDGLGHHYMIPTPPLPPLGKCRCGAEKMFSNWAAKSGSRWMISRVLGKPKQHQQLVLDGPSLWAESRR